MYLTLALSSLHLIYDIYFITNEQSQLTYQLKTLSIHLNLYSELVNTALIPFSINV